MPVHSWAGKSKVGGHHVLQSAQNEWLKQHLTELGWEAEPVLWGKNGELGTKWWNWDFKKKTEDGTIAVEVEFANHARNYADLVKFQVSHATGQADLHVHVAAAADMAKVMTGGCATFEQALNLLHNMPEDFVNFSAVYYGLSIKDTPVVSWEESQYPSAQELSGNSEDINLYHAIAAYRAGTPVQAIALPSGDELRAGLQALKLTARRRRTEQQLDLGFA